MPKLVLLAAALLLPSCGVLNQQSATNLTNVDLGSNNYVVTQTNVEGVDTGWGLLFSFLLGIPITLPSVNEAMNDLMTNVDAEGRAVGLVNVTRTVEVSNWLLFHVVQQRVRADVVEFKK